MPAVCRQLFIVLLLVTQTSLADTRVLPVQGHVELQATATAMTLEIPWRSYQQSLDEFADGGALDAAETAFRTLMIGLRADDPELAAPLLTPSDDTDALAAAAEQVDLYHTAFKRMHGLQVVGRSTFDTADLFFWQIPSDRGPFLRTFRLRPGETRFHADLISSNHTVSNLIQHSLGLAVAGGRGSRGAADGSSTFRLALPLADDSGEVSMRFRAYRVPADDRAKTPPHYGELLKFYADSWTLLSEGQREAFTARFTAGSADKLSGYLQEPSADGYIQQHTGDRRVWLVMDASPLYFVFHTRGPNRMAPDSRLYYDTVLRDPDSGQWRLTNVQYASHLDQVFEQVLPRTRAAFMQGLRPQR